MAFSSSDSEGWRIGERIQVRGAAWVVLEQTKFRDCLALHLAGGDRANRGHARTLLIPFDRPRRLRPQRSTRVVRPRRWLHSLRRAALDDRPYGSLLRAAGSTVKILPYQLEPALAMLGHGATRILITDSVGLGKTVQAGLVLDELSARQEGFRALVVAPAGLREQWCQELAVHFNLAAIAADTAWLARTARDLPADLNPWLLPGIYVASLDLLKRPEVLRPIEDVSWDLLVVDEAHGATLGTQRWAAASAIAVRARRVVLLTATPHAGDARQFAALCGIGKIDPHTDPLLIFNRTRADVGLPHRRRRSLRGVRLSAAETRMHRLLDQYTDAICREQTGGHARLAAIVLRKRALSSAGSLAASVIRRMDLLADAVPAGAHQLSLPLADEEVDDEAPDAVLGIPGLSDRAVERRWLEALREAAAAAAADESKMKFLTRVLARLREPAIVFTEYRDTLVRLQAAIARTGRTSLALHGGLTAAERAAVHRAFNESDHVLVATDAAAEGLNLQGRCRTVIHFELPWSPIRLEQRAGRVDRIGQRRTVHEIALVSNDTAERLVLAPLIRRAARAQGAPGGGLMSVALLRESRIAAAVLEGCSIEDLDEPPAEWPAPPTWGVTPAPALRLDAETEALRLRQHRAWAIATAGGSPGHDEPGACLVTAIRSRRSVMRPGVTAVYSLILATSDGHLVHRDHMAVTIPLPIDVDCRRTSDVRAAFSRWSNTHEPAVRSAIEEATRPRLNDIRRMHALGVEALDRREAAMAATVSSGAQQIVQASLFDQRAIRRAAAKRRAAASLLDEAERRAGARSESRRLVLAVDLAAVLFTNRR
jgi:superfamily II DNA or RNA helicase